MHRQSLPPPGRDGRHALARSTAQCLGASRCCYQQGISGSKDEGKASEASGSKDRSVEARESREAWPAWLCQQS